MGPRTWRFLQEGDLDSFLKNQNGQFLGEDEVLLKFVQICLGLQHVHSKVRRVSSPLAPAAHSICSRLAVRCSGRTAACCRASSTGT